MVERTRAEAQRWAGWFRIGGTYHGYKTPTPRGFMGELHTLVDRMSASPDWQGWWAPVGRPHLDLELVWNARRRDFDMKTMHRKNADGVLARIDFAYEEHTMFGPGEARRQVELLMQRLAKTYRLGAPPQLP